MLKQKINNIIKGIESIKNEEIYGQVKAVKGLVVEVVGLETVCSIGAYCEIINNLGKVIKAEVIGIDKDLLLLMPFSTTQGIALGSPVRFLAKSQEIYPSVAWMGRVIDAFGNPLDGKGPLIQGSQAFDLQGSPTPAHKRKRVGRKLNLGIRAINSFLSCCDGQRMGIFAGSGVGKSMMMAMITKFSDIEIKVIGLIGERGREVQEFIEDYLGEEGLAKAIVVVATSDESAIIRRQAAYLTLTLAEYFRDLGLTVLCMMDNLTRFAMAQREIGLAAGEPPTTKGYPPSVFSILPKLLERAGPGSPDQGSITGLFSVLVENDDTNEPIADAVRGILDGHIVLDRKIARMGIYPAIDILSSVSRTMPRCNNDYENKLVNRARYLLATYDEMSDMIKLGAYKNGTDPEIDQAIEYHQALNNFISQNFNESETLESSYKKLADLLHFKDS
jgi:flagellum-specific ATP synthase